MLSKKTKYGLHALIYLAKNYPMNESVLIADIAQEKHIPKKFLEAILLELRRHGILSSKKGKGGGYTLAKLPRDITLGQIIRVLEGPLAPVSCVSQTAYKSCEECIEEECGIRLVMKDVRNAMAQILDNTSLEDILNRIEANKADKTLTFSI